MSFHNIYIFEVYCHMMSFVFREADIFFLFFLLFLIGIMIRLSDDTLFALIGITQLSRNLL